MISLDFRSDDEHVDIQVMEHDSKLLIVIMNPISMTRILIPFEKVNEVLVNKISKIQSQQNENESV